MACIKTNDFHCWFIKKLEGLLWELKKGSGIYSFLFELFSRICLQLIYSFQSGKAVEEESTHGGNYWLRYSAQGSGDHTAHQNPGVLSPWGPPWSCISTQKQGTFLRVLHLLPFLIMFWWKFNISKNISRQFLGTTVSYLNWKLT